MFEYWMGVTHTVIIIALGVLFYREWQRSKEEQGIKAATERVKEATDAANKRTGKITDVSAGLAEVESGES